jgi:hypothetical protein
MSPAASTIALQRGIRDAQWSVRDLWVAMVSIGGNLRYRAVERIADGDQAATPREHDVLASALNDYFVERGEDHPVPLWHELVSSN